jgi:mannose-1-phosphate guanylyltransferase
MIPVGHMQKPLLEYIVRLLERHNVTRLTLLVGYKHEQIVNYFNSGDRFGVKTQYVLDEDGVKGTGASLLNAYAKGAIEDGDTLLIYYGDILSAVDLSEMIARHHEADAMATLALSRGYQVRVGVAELAANRVMGWHEKPKLDIHAGIGILVLSAAAIPELATLQTSVSELDIMSHLIPHLIAKRAIVQAYPTNAFWYDVGSAERYEKLDNGIIEEKLHGLFTD